MLNRRKLLGLAGAGAAGAVLGGCSDVGPGSSAAGPAGSPSCVPRSMLDSHARLAELPLVYEVSQRRTSFSFDTGFHDQLGRWLADYRASSGLARPDQVWTYGAYVSGGADCGSWHAAGRAFDLSRLRLRGGTFVSCRYDRWRSSQGAELATARRRYWALAASLHLEFAYVLTYLYDDVHANHIHIDNSRSGSGRSTFSTRSTTQVQAVQAICTYLWEDPVEPTGSWDAATRRASRRVLDQLGRRDDLDGSVDSWRVFLGASVPRGG